MYPLSDALLMSMAMRYDHSFGLMEDEARSKLLTKMKDLYFLYSEGLTDAQISERTTMYIVTLSQIREEVYGTGFFNPLPPVPLVYSLPEKEFYPESRELLISMAVRYHHGFGMMEPIIQVRILERMKALYDSYLQGLSNEEIGQKYDFDIVTVKQIREELTGDGFFAPEKGDFYNSFVRKEDF